MFAIGGELWSGLFTGQPDAMYIHAVVNIITNGRGLLVAMATAWHAHTFHSTNSGVCRKEGRVTRSDWLNLMA